MKFPILIIIFLLIFSTGCASTTSKPEPISPPVQKEPVATVETETEPEPASIQIVQAKPALTPPSQQRTVYFEYNSDKLSGESKAIVDTHVAFLLKNPNFQITIEGHADERGSNDYNQTLGALRAQVIKAALLERGIADKQVNLVSYGENKPAVMGNNDEAWQSNRRAILVYSEEALASQLNSSNSPNKLLASEQ